MNKRQLKKASRGDRNWRLPAHLQIRADKWFSPWHKWTHDMAPGDKYLACDGTIRQLTRKIWSNYEWCFYDTNDWICHTKSCVDQLLLEHQSLEVGTKLSNEQLNIYWGAE